MKFADVQVGTKVVKVLRGDGFVTESLTTIESVNNKGVFIRGYDGDFSDDSVCGYHFDGRPFASFTTGFVSLLGRIAP